MSSDERTFGPVPTCSRGPALAPECMADKGTMQAREGTPGLARHTDGAVLAVPAGAAFTLAVVAGPMLGTARVAGPLVTGRPHPAILAAAGAPHAHAMATTVGSTDLCGEEVGWGGVRWGRGPGGVGEGGEKTQVLSKLLGTRVTLGYLPWLL